MTNNNAGRIVPVILFLAGIINTCFSQSLNYSEIFAGDWQKALDFVNENNKWIKPALSKYDIPYQEAISVIFPELVRYSALRDKIEITLLKSLYRNLGNDYADFSVGVFQIKPSFAEKIREEIYKVMGRKAKELFKKRSSYKDDRLYRISIITDLENPETELNYVIAFIKICDDHFKTRWNDETLKIKFLATAYNTGFWKSKSEIELMSEKKFFNTRIFKTENYPYADVSLYWYNKYFLKDKNQN